MLHFISRLVRTTADVTYRETLVKIGEANVNIGFPWLDVQTPEESVSAQLKVVEGLTPADNGKFFSHTGGEYPSF